ncbi:AbrB/MazE/SpoVT family DNA-binding domain-containing protein [Candidatus Falkowbacteria bacterium]|nr:AbrB/MazE/SpoVT family DNA-binding domain-containing protein [Candidatus Falkowbacteria bacterium]
MSRRKLSEQNIRKATRMGGGKSLGLTLPISIVRKLKLRERQKLVVKLRGKKIIIEDWTGK